MSAPYYLHIVVPGNPTNLNGRQHWRAKNTENQKWINTVMMLAKSKRPPTPLKRARLIFTRFASRLCDADNFLGSLKPIIDGLKHSGIIEDDSWEHIGMPECHQFKSPRKEVRIVVEVLELTGEMNLNTNTKEL